MATYYVTQVKGVLDGAVPQLQGDGAFVDAARAGSHSIFSYAGQVNAINDIITCPEWPMNSLFESIEFFTDTVLTGATLSFGTILVPAKYGTLVAPAANTLTVVPYQGAVLLAPQYAAPEIMIITITGAALPAAGNAVIRQNLRRAA